MLERLDSHARAAVIAAHRVANAAGVASIGTEHLLLGIVAEPASIALRALTLCGVDRADLQVRLSAPRAEPPAEQNVTMTPQMRQLFEWAARESMRSGHASIGPGHLLLAFHETDPNGAAACALTVLGAGPTRLRTAVLTALSTAETPEPPARRSGDPRPGETGAVHAEPRHSGPPTGSTRQSGYTGEQPPPYSPLDAFAENWTAAAAAGRIDPVVGREAELGRLMTVLSRRTKNNPLLVGEPGVGKTAVAEAFALAIAAGAVPDNLADIQLYALDLAALIAGTKARGEFEERLKKVIAEVQRRDDVVLFIDEIHTLVAAGGSSGSLNAANIVKPLLARGDLRTVGATTLDEHRKYFEKDPALDRRFQRIDVDEPTEDATVAILAGIRPAYTQHHGVGFTDDALRAAARLAKRYVTDRFLPDSAVDLLDEAGARAAIARSRGAAPADVDENDIAEVLAAATQIPVARLGGDETSRLLNMEAELGRRLIGQHHAVSAVARTIRRTRAGLADPRRPAGSMLFAGPTGVGKTELAKTLAEFLFGDDGALITLDMSEYMEKHTVSRLIGSPPGYIGHAEGGQLTEAVRRRPYSVVLFDEIEKAHADVFDVLLQVLEEGRLTDASGRAVDFSNTVLIMTSNLGATALRAPRAGFHTAAPSAAFERMEATVTAAIEAHFRPEFRNRIDEVVCFSELTLDEVTEIAQLFIDALAGRVEAAGHRLEVTAAARNLLAVRGYDPEMGARPLRRTMQTLIEDEVAEALLAGSYEPGSTLVVDVVDAAIAIAAIPPLDALVPAS